jgi:hypothetical protein
MLSAQPASCGALGIKQSHNLKNTKPGRETMTEHNGRAPSQRNTSFTTCRILVAIWNGSPDSASLLDSRLRVGPGSPAWGRAPSQRNKTSGTLVAVWNGSPDSATWLDSESGRRPGVELLQVRNGTRSVTKGQDRDVYMLTPASCPDLVISSGAD